MDDLTVTRDFTSWFDERAATLDDAAASGASRLPRWTRGHVLTHLARNADGLVNLLTWARTGVEHPMYASDADRDADIEEGGNRIARLLQEDLSASNQRFFDAAEALSPTAWDTSVIARAGAELPTSSIPFVRLAELAVHLVDLDCGVGFPEVVDRLGDHSERLVEHAVAPYRKRDGIPPVRLSVTLPGGEVTTWRFGSGEPADVAGGAADALGWLTGRAGGASLDGPTPALPAWK